MNAMSFKVMETLTSPSAANAYSRHASKYRYAQQLTTNRGSQFRKT